MSSFHRLLKALDIKLLNVIPLPKFCLMNLFMARYNPATLRAQKLPK